MSIMKLYVDQDVARSPEVISFQSRLNMSAVIVQNVKEVFRLISSSDDPVKKSKTILFLTRNNGAFIKPCPGTSYYTCCGYKILHIGTFCIMDCSYCILQSYFHPPLLQYFVNHEDLVTQLHRLFLEKKRCRIGTGEFTDSMIWEMWTDLSSLLIPEFSKQSHCVLELKTKTTAIERLKTLNHNKKTIVSWSLNTTKVIKSEERGTASLDARLQAAVKCQAWGYPLAFHFDPMVIYDGCEDDYKKVVKKLFSSVSKDNIVWISLGTFRFMPALKPIIEKRFPDSKIVYGEFIRGIDGKMRYFKPLRIKLYKKMVSWIREFAPDMVIYFCMEDDEVWKKSMGFVPDDYGGLANMLDQSAILHCNLTAS